MDLELLNDEKEMYLFLKDHCERKKFVHSLRALYYAQIHHEGQKRKGNGLPYITHPMAVAYFLILSGIDFDNALAVAFLHDVPEDCGTNLGDLNVASDIKYSANLLNWKLYKSQYQNKQFAMMLYYYNISKDKWATITKFGDRVHNLFTMQGAFTKEKMIDYVKETITYYPYLFHEAYQKYPDVAITIQFFHQHMIHLIQAYRENDFSHLNNDFEKKICLSLQEFYIPNKKIIVLPEQKKHIRSKILVS